MEDRFSLSHLLLVIISKRNKRGYFTENHKKGSGHEGSPVMTYIPRIIYKSHLNRTINLATGE